MPLNIVSVTLPEGSTKKLEIIKYLTNKFKDSVRDRANQVDSKYKNWMDNYDAKPLQKIRTSPWYKASNFVPSLIRMHTDILHARIFGLLFGTKPFWAPKNLLGLDREKVQQLSSWLDHKSFYEMEFQPSIDMTLMRTLKTGLCVLKNSWVEDIIYTSTGDTNKPFKNENLVCSPIEFDDMFWYPITASSIETASIKFHRLRFTEEMVRYRINTQTWDEIAANKVLLSPNGVRSDAARASNAESLGIALTNDTSCPYTVIEAWFKFELEPGKLFSLVALFNPYDTTDTSLLRLYYNYNRDPRTDAFTGFQITLREGSPVGYGIPELLETSQEEQAQVHNARRDANTLANVPTWKKKRFGDVPNPSTEWYPGKVFELDNMDDLQTFEFNRNYNAMIEEENQILSLSERYTGVSPAQQGFGSGSMGKRGIYSNSGTLALLTEGNRRLNIYLARMRYPFHRVGRTIYESYRDFKPDEGAEYAKGELNSLPKAFAEGNPTNSGTFFELGASDAGANKEADRTSLLLMSNTLASYYKEIMGGMQMVVGMPDGSPAKELLLQVLDGAKDLADRVLFAFDVHDHKKLIPDVRRVLGGKSPQDGPNPLVEGRMQPPEGDVSEQGLRDISSTVGQIASSVSSNGVGVR